MQPARQLILVVRPPEGTRMGQADDEILALLREIRDLQKRHLEHYLAFTARVLEQQREAAARAEADAADSLAEQRRVGQAALAEQMRIGWYARLSVALVPVTALVLVVAVAVLAWVALSR